MSQPDFGHILGNSIIPPSLRAQLPTNPKPRTPQETLAMLVTVITGLATRGTDATNGLTVATTPDERGVTIRIDLPR